MAGWDPPAIHIPRHRASLPPTCSLALPASPLLGLSASRPACHPAGHFPLFTVKKKTLVLCVFSRVQTPKAGGPKTPEQGVFLAAGLWTGWVRT